VRFERLLSSVPADLLSENGCSFTRDRDIALYYAAYAKRRDGVDSVVLVQIRIPNSAIESLSETELLRVYWPSFEWKNLVFHCRRHRRLPSTLKKFRQAKLIIGTISTKPTMVYDRLDSPEEITERFVNRGRDGRLATQYVWPQQEGEEFLEQHRQLRVFPLTSQEYSHWRSHIESEDAGLL
jgi:hypothetical protein